MPVRRGQRAPPPSPVWLLLLLGVLLSMMVGSSYWRALRYDSTIPRMASAVQNTKSLGLGAIIPIVLLVLAVEIFAVPAHRHADSPIYVLVESVAQNLTFPMFITIILLLLLAGLLAGVNRPWQYQSAYQPQCVYRRNKWHCY